MDAFYAAVETRDDPRLRGRPVVVGGTGGRGVVSSASYEARAFGVRSAMPMAEATRRCPAAVVVAPRFAVYRRASESLHVILRSVTPLVEPLALDEAFLDVSGAVRLLGAPPAIGAALRRRIADELGLSASVGVAANKFLAKVCSRRAKPDGLLHLPAARSREFLDALPVDELWGVGPRIAGRLTAVGLRSIRDVRTADHATLIGLVGPAMATRLAALAAGDDPRGVEPDVDAKGLSAEQTFAADLCAAADVQRALLALCERVARRLRHNGLQAHTVTLKLREASWRTHTRSRTLAGATSAAARLYPVVSELATDVWSEPAPVRLLGVGVTRLAPTDEGRQLSLLTDERWERAEQVADRVRAQFGDVALMRGALLERGQRLPTAANADDLPARRRGPR
jgi:DNA polymerase-4